MFLELMLPMSKVRYHLPPLFILFEYLYFLENLKEELLLSKNTTDHDKYV
jgi:hypothetical protein